jgi:hypothetical protein
MRSTRLPTKARPAGGGGRSRGLVAAPDDDFEGGLDVLDAVAVGEVPIAGE